MAKQKKDLKDGLLTHQMDLNTHEFNQFQAKLLNRSEKRTEEQKRTVELLALKYRMEDYLQSDDESVKLAGEFLKQFLNVLKIKQVRFAEYIGVKPSNLSKLLNGERSINYELALILGKLFKIDPMIWIEIQAKNEMNRLRRANDNDYSDYSLNDLIPTDNDDG